MPNEIDLIGDKVVLKIPENVEVQMNSLWENGPVVITYFRRFGCILCRQGAAELSKISPILKSHGVRLIGVGLEEVGVQEFIDGKYFSGELYVDTKAEQYKVLGFKKYNVCSILLALLERAVRVVNSQAKKNKIGGNFKGNGFQAGGTLIVNKGGSDVLLSYKMQGLADHLENIEILKALGIDASELAGQAIDTQPSKAKAALQECDSSQCQLDFGANKKDK